MLFVYIFLIFIKKHLKLKYILKFYFYLTQDYDKN